MYACICRGITESDVRRVGAAGVTDPAALISTLGLDDDRCCGRCVRRIDEFAELAWQGADAAVAPRRGLRLIPVLASA